MQRARENQFEKIHGNSRYLFHDENRHDTRGATIEKHCYARASIKLEKREIFLKILE